MNEPSAGANRVYLVDANIYAHRAFERDPFADSTTRAQGHSGTCAAHALENFADNLARLCALAAGNRLILVFDGPDSRRLRQAIDPTYKANRKPASQARRWHLSCCRRLCGELGIETWISVGVEADDVIATLAATYRQACLPSTVVSADKDLLQVLATPADRWLDTSNGRSLDVVAVRKRFGVEADMLAELWALIGDAVDNIPGVPGLTRPAAAFALRRLGGLQRLLDQPDRLRELGLKRGARLPGLVEEHRAQIHTAFDLARARIDLDLRHAARPATPAIDGQISALASLSAGCRDRLLTGLAQVSTERARG